MPAPFVPADFTPPTSFEGPGFRLEPLGPEHNKRDHNAWMSSIDHIRSTPGFDGPDSRWPVSMSLERNLEDLVGHARDFSERTGFTYSILDGDEVIGCVYIYPTNEPAVDARITSWVVATRAEVDSTVRETLASWIDTIWPFAGTRYPGRI